MGAANTAGSMFLSNKQKTLGDFMPQILKILENGTGVANNNATSNSSQMPDIGVIPDFSMKLFGDNFNLGKALMQVGKSTIPTGSNTGFGNEPPFSGTPKKKLGTSIGNVAGNIGNIFTNAYEDIANFLKNLFGGQ